GSPCYMDSEGTVRILNRSFGNSWAPICNTRTHCKGKSDHYWVVGVHENPQQLRCIPCKGSRFPPTLPRPAVAVLPFQLPYCQITTEKGQMEEQYWRSLIFTNYFDYLSKHGYECDENVKTEAQKEQQELLMKMFALSCKLEREFRCMELAELMTQNVMNLAIKYASRSKKLVLAQRLSEMALEKAAELAAVQQQEDYDDEEEDLRTRHNAGYSRTTSEWSDLHAKPVKRDQYEELNEHEEEVEEENLQKEVPENSTPLTNPFSKSAKSPDGFGVKAGAVLSSNQGRVNPFKVHFPYLLFSIVFFKNTSTSIITSIYKVTMPENQCGKKYFSPST
ncbi:hypothetical protein GDO86_012937, partial [Hymenochirus boettgeri]